MKLLNAKRMLFAVAIAAVITGPALAQQPARSYAQQRQLFDPSSGTGRGLYDMVPDSGAASNRFDPAATGGGSFGYNQMLHDNKW